MIRRAGFSLVIALGLGACGDDEAIREAAYEEGYNDGQYDVCRELGGIAPGVKDRLRHCRGY